MPICENCLKEHDGTYGSGRFCSATCARGYSQCFISPEARERQIAALNDPIIRHEQLEHRRRNAEERKQARELERAKKHEEREEKRRANHERMIATARDNSSIDKIIEHNANNSSNTFAIHHPLNLPDRMVKRMDRKYSACQSQIIGACGELAAAKKFIEHGFRVFMPVTSQTDADLIVLVNDRPQKIQVKSTNSGQSRQDHYISTFKLSHTKLNAAPDSGDGRRISGQTEKYDADIAAFVLYDYALDELFMIPNIGKRAASVIAADNNVLLDDHSHFNMDDILSDMEAIDKLLE